MTDSLVVTASDCLRCGFCPTGIMSWCKSNGFETRDFLKNGLPSDVVRATGDAFALRALAAAEGRAAREQR